MNKPTGAPPTPTPLTYSPTPPPTPTPKPHRKMRILDYVQPDPSSFKFDKETNTVCVRHGEPRNVRAHVRLWLDCMAAALLSCTYV